MDRLSIGNVVGISLEIHKYFIENLLSRQGRVQAENLAWISMRIQQVFDRI